MIGAANLLGCSGVPLLIRPRKLARMMLLPERYHTTPQRRGSHRAPGKATVRFCSIASLMGRSHPYTAASYSTQLKAAGLKESRVFVGRYSHVSVDGVAMTLFGSSPIIIPSWSRVNSLFCRDSGTHLCRDKIIQWKTRVPGLEKFKLT